MSEKQYVQHISGQGEKWEVNHVGPDDYQVQGGRAIHYLPKSEFVLCPAPEVWRDVTEECRVDDYSNRAGDFWSILHATTGANVMSKCNDSFRLRKVQIAPFKGWVFIVEKKVQP